jgi:hypothetical protein
VPILAPKTTKIPLSKEIVDEATIATAIEVTVELLCIKAVDNNPINSEIKGSSAIFMRSLVVPIPIEDSAKIMRSIASKKSKIIDMIDNILIIHVRITEFSIYRTLFFVNFPIKIKVTS